MRGEGGSNIDREGGEERDKPHLMKDSGGARRDFQVLDQEK